MKNRHLFFIVSFIIASAIASAQTAVYLRGKIIGPSGNSVPGATIHLLNTLYTTTSDSSGAFIIVLDKEGSYELSLYSKDHGSLLETIQVMAGHESPLVFQLTGTVKQLATVIVTAQKKEEDLLRVPLSVSALDEKKVGEYRLWNIDELKTIVPNLFAGNPGDGRNVVAIRGIVSTSYDPAVTTYIDGVNQFTLDTYLPSLFDVAGIEVLRGPQSCLYGRNAMGGVINITTKQPAGHLESFAEISMGNYGEKRYTAGIRTPLIKNKLYFGAAGLYEASTGFYKNDFTTRAFDQQHRAGSNYYLKYITATQWKFVLNLKQLANRNKGAFPLAASAETALSEPFHVNQDATAMLVDNTLNSALSVQHTGNKMAFSSATAYQSNYRYYTNPLDGDFSPLNIITIVNDYGKNWNKVKALTQEIKFTSLPSSISRWKWTAGIYGFYQYAPNKQATHFGSDAGYIGSTDSNYSVINTTRSRNWGAAFYGQLYYTLQKGLFVFGGLRYDHQHSASRILGEYQPDASPAPIFQTQADTAATASYQALSPMAGISYEKNKQLNVFFIYTRGYRTGGLTPLSPDPMQPPLYPFKPEFSNNLEAGIKSRLLNNKLSVCLAVFTTHVNNAQVPTLVLPDAITVTRNAGRLISKGIETEINSAPLKGLELCYSFGYTDARYRTLKIAQNGTITDLSGKKQVFTPSLTNCLALQYTLNRKAHFVDRFFARSEWMYIGNHSFDPANTIVQDGYHLLNARAGIHFSHMELSVWSRNILDRRYIAYAYDFGAAHLGAPVTYGMSLRFQYPH